MACDRPMGGTRSQTNPEEVNLERYAADVAPVIDGIHQAFHRRTGAVMRESRKSHDSPQGRPPHAGILITLRFAFADRPLPLSTVKLALRYSPPADVTAWIDELVEAGWLCTSGELLHPTEKAQEWIGSLYGVQADVATKFWSSTGADLPALAEQAERLLVSATETGGPAFTALYPPYERAGSPVGLFLFNRLAVLRYHRADAHAAAWEAEGLTAQEIVDLGPGELRDHIEAETNRGAAPPFAALSAGERRFFLAGLRSLPMD